MSGILARLLSDLQWHKRLDNAVSIAPAQWPAYGITSEENSPLEMDEWRCWESWGAGLLVVQNSGRIGMSS